MSEYHVYELIDPRDGAVFYIGCSKSPKKRLAEHGNDQASAAHCRVRELRQLGLRPGIVTVATYDNKHSAQVHEAQLIRSLPNLLNVDCGDQRCSENCRCAKHDPTPFLGNPNWASEYTRKRRARVAAL